MPEKSFSFFDFDSTIYKGQSRYLILDFAAYLQERNSFFSSELELIISLNLSYSNGKINRHDFAVQVVESYYRGLAGCNEIVISNHACDYWDHIKTDAWFPYTFPLLKIINNMTTSILVSGSPFEILDHIRNKLGVKEIYASKGIIHNGIYTGLTDYEMATYTAKAELMQKLSGIFSFDPETSFAFGDSESDFPLLRSVDPKNAYLLGATSWHNHPGVDNNWNILELEKDILSSVNLRINTVFH